MAKRGRLVPKRGKFKAGDIVSVTLDDRDPAHPLRYTKQERVYGVGIVIATDMDDDVCIQWITAPRDAYYMHREFDVYVSPNRCRKVGEVGEVQGG